MRLKDIPKSYIHVRIITDSSLKDLIFTEITWEIVNMSGGEVGDIKILKIVEWN